MRTGERVTLVAISVDDAKTSAELARKIAKDGKGEMGRGLVDDADVTLTTDYGTAKDVFGSGNQQAGMQAFMAGKVKVQGDMTKLMMGQQGGGNQALSEAIQGITE